MSITRAILFRGCLLSSIVHAVMTNNYPVFSYEQSWDGTNYSIQNSSGLYGTITFETDYCVGAIRNENADCVVGGDYIRGYMRGFPSDVACKAYEEALQYLLLEKDGIVIPFITSVFWADNIGIHFDESCIERLKEDFVLFESILLPKEIALKKYIKEYDMDKNAIELVNKLYSMKERDFLSVIKLNEREKSLIPGEYINDECAELLKELKIYT